MGMHLPVALFLRGGAVWGRGGPGQVVTDRDSTLFNESPAK